MIRLVFCACCFLLVIPFSALILYLVLKGKKQAWTGTITGKNCLEKDDFDHPGRKEISYIVKVMVDGDREHSIAVDKGRYNEWKVGDRLKKESGKMWPEKVA